MASGRLTAGPPDDDALNGAVLIVTDATNSTQKGVGAVQDFFGGTTHRVILATSPAIPFTITAGDKVDVIAWK